MLIAFLIFKSNIGDYEYGNDNPYQASEINSQSYAYDDNGNLTNDGIRAMLYDYMDRMYKVTAAGQVTNYFELRN